ncbi:MAG TPA: signal peptidase I, partial [Gaiellaceae bacterium]|nr:signal peptidase I [Gaiellaceae bacterium]
MKITIGTLITGIATVVLLVGGWFFLAPTQLGGSVSYVQIYGTSMQPHFHAGDLVVVRAAPSYHVGEIVAYENGQLGNHVVMHRIIGLTNGHYTFKGDNNNFIDSYHPVRTQLVGRMWLHVPMVGTYLMWLHGMHLIILLGIVGLFAVFGTALRGGRRPGRERRTRAGTARPSGSGSFAIAPIVAAALALAFAGLAALSWTRPLTAPTARPGIYTQTGRFGYDATVPGGQSVYGSTTVKTGQPLFTQLVHSVRFHFDYSFASTTKHAVTGTIGLDAVVTGASGWKRTLHLAAPQTFSGDHASAVGVLAFKPLQTLLKRVDTLSNATGGTYTVTLTPQVDVHGIVAGSAVREHFAPQLPLMLDPSQLQLQPGGATGPSAAAALTQSTSGSGLVSAPSRISLLKFHLSVQLARRIALFGGVGALVALLGALLLARRTRPADEHEMIRREYGDLIIDVEVIPTASAANTIKTAAFDGIARVAEQSGHVIMHLER